MSMAILTGLQLAGIAAAYFIAVLLLPWLFLRKWLAGFGSVSVRFMIYFLAGNFYIINLVYLLQFLHISCRLTLFLGTAAPFTAAAVRRYRGSFLQLLEKRLGQIMLVLGGETGRKTLLLRMRKRRRRFFGAIGKKSREWFKRCGLEMLLISGLTVLLVYMYGSNAVNVYGYGASDIAVHNYWINEMGHNNIFAGGVYPFGMHCLLYYLHGIFGIHTNVLLRLFYVVQTVMAHMMLLAFLRNVCKSRYAPYIGVIIYIVSNRLYYYTYIRYYATLPQEMGMIFILPAAYFAIAFLQEKNPVFRRALPDAGVTADHPAGGPDAGKAKKTKRREETVTAAGIYLTMFAVSVSLTLAIHFYDTFIAGLFCIAIGVGFCFRVFRWQYLKRIVAAGIAGLFMAILPMGIAFLFGTPLQESLNWGMTQWEASTSSHTQAGTAEEGLSALETILDRLEYYVVYDIKTGQVILVSIGILLGMGLLGYLFRKAEYGAVLVSVGTYMAIMAVLQASLEFGIVQILDVSRYSVYLGYGIPAVWGLCVDSLLYVLFRKGKLLNFCSFAVLTGACVMTAKEGLRSPIFINAYETNGSVICLNNIIRENKEEAWTICSANDERQMIGDYKQGYHYELIKFLRNMRSLDEDTSIKIPTSTVYFFVEKIPVLYRDYMTLEKPDREVSQEGARKPLSDKPGIQPYLEEDRWITMSHMYYWAQAFKELYPNEMEVYYESDDFVCYRVRQNEYSLYNFAIDYGYNGYDKMKKD